jgi:RNA polymerase sigma factor (sigma-70 family)
VNRDTTNAFARLYENEVWSVYGFFGYRLGSRQEAEDLTQLTFERALRAWDRFDANRASGRTWLLTIARNLLVDHYRSADPVRKEPLPQDDAGESVLGQAEPVEPRLGPAPDLEAALGTLDDRERELIALRFGGDLTGPQIAELMGLSLANVQQILSRTLRKLRAEIEARPAAQPTTASSDAAHG